VTHDETVSSTAIDAIKPAIRALFTCRAWHWLSIASIVHDQKPVVFPQNFPTLLDLHRVRHI
jgi:hypothetical protein